MYYNYKLGLIILRVQDSIEVSLDTLDSSYKVISSILLKPIFFDSLEVRQVMSEIGRSRDAVLYVANSLIDIDKAQVELKDGSED